MAGEPFPVAQVLALLAAALRGDEEGARLLVDTVPRSQLRDLAYVLARMLAGAITAGAPGAGDLPAEWLSVLLADLEGGGES